jgi:hypothetical protein
MTSTSVIASTESIMPVSNQIDRHMLNGAGVGLGLSRLSLGLWRRDQHF